MGIPGGRVGRASVAVACWVVSCSSGGDGDGSGAGLESSVPNLIGGGDTEQLRCDDERPDAADAYRAFYEELQTLYCERQFECCSAQERGAAAEDTREECLARVGYVIRGLSSSNEDGLLCGRVQFQADAAAGCLDEIRGATCDEVKDLPNCVGDGGYLLLRGTSSVGGLCEDADSLDCAGGYCDTDREVYGAGRCASLKPDGESCYFDSECESRNCLGSENACVPPSDFLPDVFCRRN